MRGIPRAAAALGVAAGVAASVSTLLGGCEMMPQWNPSGGTGQTQVTQPPVAAGYYRVNPGDSLPSIAAAFGQRPEDIASWNNLVPGSAVMVGQVLRVAPPAGANVPQAPGVVENAVPMPAPTPAPMPQAPATPTVQLAWPVHGTVMRPFTPGQSKGIVIGARPGDAVRAAAAGRVVYAGTGMPAYGPLIIIKHDASVVTAYGQNGQLFVKEGDAVAQGQQIGTVGTDPRGVPSIQFEVRWDGRPVDPLAWLPRQ
ncbi:peptidoglycan DD-metalloendopeptidase family protein [Paraburkholderia phosphatilytica]|uniref:peptidoglycan DD-metalloendopeptidase family protein n=1 Tax=Paraburkholderia phosphatilytica TaxID=2282883 RepID=UPI000E55520E|nr:peptidoglycan DD-metalloendopeptidase family protein [Paraburkholderia phosphatilytica]